MLVDQGFRNASIFNFVIDDLEGSWDLVLADAVLLHLNRKQFAAALLKVHAALAGAGEEWSTEKLEVPRFFCYWQDEAVAEELRRAGFSSCAITTPEGWLHVVASR